MYFRERRLSLGNQPTGTADRYKVQVRSRPSALQGIGQDPVVQHGLDGWTMKRAPDGVAYYHHDVLGTQFERPIGFDMSTGGGNSKCSVSGPGLNNGAAGIGHRCPAVHCVLHEMPLLCFRTE